MGVEAFNGYQARRLLMPDDGQIACFFYRGSGNECDVYDGNHNVFRIDKDGAVMWQVTRVDYPDVNWESKHRHAREDGKPGCIEPFIEFVLEMPDGTRYPEGSPVDVIEWRPNCLVKLVNLGLGTQWFSLDVDTGIATEITARGHRPW